MNIRRYFSGNNVENDKMIIAYMIFLFILIYVSRFLFPVPYAGSWDIVDFALGVQQFDLLEMQPHFPGYPYFILGGMIFNLWLNDPIKSLTFFNSMMMAMSAVPIFLLARQHFSLKMSVIVMVSVQSLSYYSVLSTQPMSEASAIAVLWWYLWSLNRANHHSKLFIKCLPGFLFGLLMGIRLSYLVFGIGLLWVWYQEWNQKHNLNHLFIQVGTAVFFQFIWIYSLIASLGGLNSFYKIALSFVKGHFNDWGGTIATSEQSLIVRIYQLFFENLLWTATFSQSWLVAIFFISLFIYCLVDLYRYRSITFKNFEILLVILVISYFLWVLFAQNIEKPRHIAPLVSIIFYLLLVVFFHTRESLRKVIFIVIFCTVQIGFGIYIVQKQYIEIPAVYQLADVLSNETDDIIIYTWEETRVFEYLQVPFSHKKIQTYETFLQDIKAQKGKRILLTDHVVKGFIAQGASIKDQIKMIGSFRSTPLYEPVYNQIVLYEWK